MQLYLLGKSMGTTNILLYGSYTHLLTTKLCIISQLDATLSAEAWGREKIGRKRLHTLSGTREVKNKQ